MKTISISNIILATILSTFSLASCEAKSSDLMPDTELIDAENMSMADQSLIGLTANQIVPGNVTETDIEHLLYMLEEEKLAHDVYIYFNEKYNRRVFQNISKSETVHQKAVMYLINLFDVEAPEAKPFGEFHHPELQALYTKLITEAETLEDALKVGALIEEVDIMDLKKGFSETQNENIKRVFSNLLRASGFHLKAFVRNLNVRGIDYQPQILSQEEFNAILGK
ncbi:MAG: hypothetical protein BWY08_02239 [Bacteroidetes bacterium ADurb.Bin174]|nr:MAG: hypothetical protein BWY08_02239 [Bacteroidetes bacterium ADurb.Bin174]